jgi:pyrroline-5-carboxylate reductase
MKIGIIGGGNIAVALIKGLLRSDVETDLRVVDRNPDKCRSLSSLGKIRTAPRIGADVLDTDVVLLAVKPHDLVDVTREIARRPWRPLVISLAAGASPSLLSEWLDGHSRVVWAMPNTSAAVARSVTGLYAAPEVSAADRAIAESVFAPLGMTLWLQHERMMAALIGISGCGPAYVYFMMEALEAAAISLGFAPDVAAQLSKETFGGAIALVDSTQCQPSELRARVTTRKGVTEHGIDVLRSNGFAEALLLATQSADARALSITIAMKPVTTVPQEHLS